MDELSKPGRLIAAELKVAPTKKVEAGERVFFCSDLHIGDGSAGDLFNGKDEEFLRFLDHVEEHGDKLVILGDCLDFYLAGSFERILRAHKRVLRRLKQLADTMEVVYVWGNHDDTIVIFEDLLNFKLCERMILDDDILIVHGHEFDMFFEDAHNNNGEEGGHGAALAVIHSKAERFFGQPLRSPLATYPNLPNRVLHWFGYRILRVMQAYAWILRKLGLHTRSRKARRFVNFWNRSEQGDLQGIYQEMKRKLPDMPYRAIMMGHTHLPGIVRMGEKLYINTGTWVHNRSTYVFWNGKDFQLRDWMTGVTFTDELYRPLDEGILPMQEWWAKTYRGWFRFEFDRDPCALPPATSERPAIAAPSPKLRAAD